MELLRKFKNTLIKKGKETSRQKKLIILDSYWPSIHTSFKVAEYNYYLKEFENCEVLLDIPNYKEIKGGYSNCHPELLNRISSLDGKKDLSCSLFYTLFINNAYRFLPIFKRNGTPFIFTLYPGGGFGLNNKGSDKKLSAVLGSKLLRKVIVTETITKKYILDKKFCTEDKVELIYGGITPSDLFKKNYMPKKYYKKDKDTFDICFVGKRYSEKGADKGYDTFIKVAKKLIKRSNDIRFHVAGGIDENEIDVSEIKNKIIFYGLKHITFFPKFYSKMDIILSPNIPFKLYFGNFDSFPTTCCKEAGFAGTAVFCTDELHLNTELKNHHDICIIPKDPDGILEIILKYFNDLDSLYNLAHNCQKNFLRLFNLENQMEKKLQIIEQNL